MKKWLKERISTAVTNREKLDVLVAILKEEHEYDHGDFYFDEKAQLLVIRNVVVVAWNKEENSYSLSIAVNIEPLGLAILINGIHRAGVHNIKIFQTFYISDKERLIGDSVKLFFNNDADEQYKKELQSNVKEEMFHDMIQTRMLLDDSACSKTVH